MIFIKILKILNIYKSVDTEDPMLLFFSAENNSFFNSGKIKVKKIA